MRVLSEVLRLKRGAKYDMNIQQVGHKDQLRIEYFFTVQTHEKL